MKRIFQWASAILMLMISLGSLSQGMIIEGILALLLGLFILPPIHWNIKQKLHPKLSPGLSYTIAILLFMGFAIPSMSRTRKEQEKEEKRTALEKAKKDSLAAIEMEAQKKSLEAKSKFLKEHDYVSFLAYDEWMEQNKDSINDPSLKVVSFLRQQRKYNDSLTYALRQDSIQRAKEARKIAQQQVENSSNDVPPVQVSLQSQREYNNNGEVYVGSSSRKSYTSTKGRTTSSKRSGGRSRRRR